jgi:hypothetical protein
MNLGYELAQALPLLRAQAVSRFTETFAFFMTEEGPVDPETFEPTVIETPVATGVAGRVKMAAVQGQDVESGGQYPVVTRLEVHVAVGAVEANPGVFVRVTGSTADASLVGRVFMISEPPSAGQVTAARWPVREVS